MRKKIMMLALAVSMVWASMPVFANDYKDIQAHWAKENIYSFKEQGFIDEFSGDKFLPNHSITRLELITLLNRAMGLEGEAEVPFSDVSKESPSHKEISTALANGYITGFGDGSFRPNAPVSRAEICVFLQRLNKIPKSDGNSRYVTDLNKAPAWAIQSVQAAANADLLKGYEDGSFGLTKRMTRAETITILSNLKGKEKEDGLIVRSEADLPKSKLIEKDLIISEEFKDKALVLDGFTIQGNLIIRGKGSSPIQIKDTKVRGEVQIARKDSNVVFRGDSSARQIRVFTQSTVSAENLSRELAKLVVSKDFVGDRFEVSAPTKSLQVYKKVSINVKENIQEVSVFGDQKQVHFTVDKNKSIGKITEGENAVTIEKTNPSYSENKKKPPVMKGGGGAAPSAPKERDEKTPPSESAPKKNDGSFGKQTGPNQGGANENRNEQAESDHSKDVPGSEGKQNGEQGQAPEKDSGSVPEVKEPPSTAPEPGLPPAPEKTPQELEKERMEQEEEARKQKERLIEEKAKKLEAFFAKTNPSERYLDSEGNIRIILWTQGITPPTMKHDFRLKSVAPGYREYQVDYLPDGNWYDINKLDGVENDDFLCFASVSANMLHWWYHQNRENIRQYVDSNGQENGIPPISSESGTAEKSAFRSSLNAKDFIESFSDPSDSKFMKLFLGYFGHLKTGFNSDILADLMINGYRPKDNGAPHAKEKGFRDFKFDNRGGLFYPVFGDEPLTERFFSGNYSSFGKSIQTKLIEGKIVGLEHTTAGRGITHIITLWGAEYDVDGNITGIFITDSDDGSYEHVAMRRFDVVKINENPHLSTKIDKKGGSGIEYIQTLSQGKELWEEYFERQNP